MKKRLPILILLLISCESEPTDSDNDGIIDSEDQCPATPEGDSVDESGCSHSQLNYFELVYGGEQNEPWEKYEQTEDGPGQNGNLVQSFSEGTSSSVDCELCEENEIHNVIALTIDELNKQYSESSWPDLSTINGDHLIRFYADGRNNSSEGVGGGPINGSYSKRVELSDNRTEGMYTNGDERYYTLSFWPPKEIWDNSTKYSTIITQWKQFGGGRPNFEVRLSQIADYKITVISIPNSIDHQQIATADPNKWNHLKYYIKNSTENDGAIKIWFNGNLVYTYQGVTMYTPDKDGYVKFGMYTEMRDERTLLFDAIKISNGLNGKSLDEWAKDQN